MEHYGVVGTGTAPKKAINASLDDIGLKATYIIPWYGRAPKENSGLECVYDWVTENDAMYKVVSAAGAKPVHRSIAERAIEIIEVDDVDLSILRELKDVAGLTLVLWDDEDTSRSTDTAMSSINFKLPTLELTNGLTPIIIESDTPAVVEVTDSTVNDMEELDVSSFDRETLEVMPAAHVKRLARNAGYEVKTKEEAISVILGEPLETKPNDTTGTLPISVAEVAITFDNGDQVTYRISRETMSKIHQLVVDEFAGI